MCLCVRVVCSVFVCVTARRVIAVKVSVLALCQCVSAVRVSCVLRGLCALYVHVAA